jgi:hypothetical protein
MHGSMAYSGGTPLLRRPAIVCPSMYACAVSCFQQRRSLLHSHAQARHGQPNDVRDGQHVKRSTGARWS